nr:MAG TPA: hypothetical protein [Caudoviricetes sp.]
MDRNDLVPQEKELQVTYEEIIAELNAQITTLNFDLTVSKLAIKKLQEALIKSSQTVDKKGNDF